ncbi:hypothetical protein D7X30_10420 [Corallococcus sp. AB011P]|uniref:type VI secretion system baseplate subunit TssK n=1 Tax=Corallococcus sp. AB011P TaxID=2316735 RepID=UPI000EA3C69A|nr:type VI secretion system baseplate subunit TssK [Corallococcus sp. AB011P]RKG59470.1 hypothetical protein D7X30_10420 [Corallococcus sp. AB011P]
MSRDDTIPPPIHWSDGMLLMPQHFQQQAHHHEESLRYHLRLLNPFHWGVRRLSFDAQALAEGFFRVQELEAVFEDGLTVRYPPPETDAGRKPQGLALDLGSLRERASQQPVTVFLAVSDDKFSGTSSDHSRFQAQSTGKVRDEHTDDGDARLTVLLPRIKLQADEATPGYSLLPLVAIECVQAKFRVVDGDVAPRIATDANSPLWMRCAWLAKDLRARAASLDDSIRTASADTERALVHERERLLHHLVAGLPAFEALLATEPHPFTLYLGLCSLAGQLAAIGHSRIPPPFARYEHASPGAAFNSVIEFIRVSLDQGVSDLFTAIPLRQLQDRFSTQVEADWLDREWVIGIQGTPGTTERQLLDWMRGARIGAETQLKGLREKRSVGVPRVQVNQCRGLLAPRGTLLFSLTPEPGLLEARQPLAVENPRDPEHPRALAPPAQLTLFVGPRTRSS